jgi:hypothetical protein
VTLANNYISHHRTRRSRQRRLWTWVYAGLAICVAMAVSGAVTVNAQQSTLTCNDIRAEMEIALIEYELNVDGARNYRDQASSYLDLAREFQSSAADWAMIYIARCKK